MTIHISPLFEIGDRFSDKAHGRQPCFKLAINFIFELESFEKICLSADKKMLIDI